MNHDALSNAMFWVGAMFAFTPLVVGGSVIAIMRWMRRREKRTTEYAVNGKR